MIDNISILLTTILVAVVVLRAATMNRSLPWFETRSMYDKTVKKAAADGPGTGTPRGRAALMPANLLFNRR
jgi:hypothetical protein